MIYLTLNKHWDLVVEYNLDKLLYLLIDRPDKTNKDYCSMYWYNNKGEYHRNYDLPAAHNGGNLQWNINGNLADKEPHLISKEYIK